MKKSIGFILLFVSPFSFGQQLDAPNIDLQSGFYTSDVDISASHVETGVTIHYTLNGGDPLETDAIYSAPISLASRIGEPNSISEIATNPSFTYPMGLYTMSRANNRGWLAPNGEVFKINVIRFKAYKTGFLPSETITRTIIVDPAGSSIYNLPVLSFVTDSVGLFSDASGIYHYGDHPDGNYTQKGIAWERNASMEYFDENGVLQIQQEVRTRIHGAGSRHSTRKTFRVYSDIDTLNNFDYTFFDNSVQDKFKRILIRSGGHRPDCFPRDDLANIFTEGLSCEQQHLKHVILFVNGEYWGIHSIKERVDKYFIQNLYGIDDNDVTILDHATRVQYGSAADSLEMTQIVAMADTSDMTLDANYSYITDRIDIESYLDYMASEIYLSNEDWVYNNVLLWKKSEFLDPSLESGYNGKFRWIFYDFDGAFGGTCSNVYYTVNTLEAATITSGGFEEYSLLFRGLLEHPEFKNRFINRLCDLMNSNFRSNELHPKISQVKDDLDADMMENVDRWRYPSEATTLADRAVEIPSLVQWDTTFYGLHRFANRRSRKVKEHIIDKWGYGDSTQVTLDVNDPSMGAVQINTILVNSQLPGTETIVYPWTGQYIDSVICKLIAVPLPGYEFVEWLESGITDDTTYWMPSSDTTITAVFQLNPTYSPVVINEVMPSNSSYLADNNGDFDDWLELFNPNPYPINLSNCTISRDTFNWVIQNGTIIAPNEYLLIWHDEETYQGSDHANFRLPNNTRTVYLYSPSGVVMDYLIYPETFTNNSFGRYPNGSGTFSAFTFPTPRGNNDVSTVEEIAKSDFLVYPNPAKNEIWFNTVSNFELFSLDGKVVLRGQATNHINLSNIQNGTYILRTDGGEINKIVISK